MEQKFSESKPILLNIPKSQTRFPSPDRPVSNCYNSRTCYPARAEPDFEFPKQRVKTAHGQGQFNDRGLKYGQASTSMLTEQKYNQLQKMKKNLTSFGGISFSERIQQKQQQLRFDRKVKFSPKKIE